MYNAWYVVKHLTIYYANNNSCLVVYLTNIQIDLFYDSDYTFYATYIHTDIMLLFIHWSNFKLHTKSCGSLLKCQIAKSIKFIHSVLQR